MVAAMSAGRARWRALAGYGLPALVYLVFLFALFWRLWTPIEGAQRTFGWDAQWQYWGDLQFLYDALADGELPLWNPHDRTGYPYHADPQAGLFYPPNWIVVAGAALTGEVSHWAVAVKVIFHFWLACFGVHVYLRRRGVHQAACFVGGAVFILGYPHLQNLFSALNWNIAWAPWVLLAIDRWIERPTRPRGALVALTAAMCALAGGPASFWYSMLIIAPYGIWAIASGARAAPDRRSFLRAALVSGATGAGLFLAIVLAQYHSTAELIGHTVRGDRDLSFITTSTFAVDDLAGLVIPRMLGTNPYLSAAAVVWAVIAVTAFATPRRFVLAGLGVLGILCALGGHGDFLAAAASAFDPFGFFRRAHRYLYVAQLPVALLAAEGLSELLRLDRAELARRLLRAIWLVGVVAVLVFGVGFAVNQKPHLDPQPLRDAFVLACLAFALTTGFSHMILRRSGTWRTVLGYVAAAFVAGDLWFARSQVIDKALHPIPATSRDGELAQMDGTALERRIYDRAYLGYRPGTRLGVRDFGGYEDDPLALSRYHHLLERARRAPRHLGHANVGFLLEGKKQKLRKSPLDSKSVEQMGPGVSRVRDVAPAVLWVDRATVAGDPNAALAALLKERPGTAAVVERDTLSGAERTRASRVDSEARPVGGRLVELARNRLIAEVDAPADGLVVIHEAYFPHWRAWVDGDEVDIVPANGLFRGVLVAQGSHRIEMRYEPPGWLTRALVSLLGLLGACALSASPLLRPLRRRKRRGTE
jgi:hypothetical protein